MTRTIISELEISQTTDELVIRGRRMAVVVSLLFALVLVPCSIAIAYQNVAGTGDVPALRNRSTNDRIVVVLILMVIVLAFTITPIALFLLYLRKRQRSWVFNRQRRQLSRGDQTWPLADLAEVAVDVRRRGRANFGSESAGVVLHFRDTQTLELTRYHASGGPKGYSLENRIAVAESLADMIAEFLQVPVRRPPPPDPGFEVVMPGRP
jgi:hypothetical protein